MENAYIQLVVSMDDLKVEIDKQIEQNIEDPKLTIIINDKQIEVPLWSADIVHILGTTADAIIEFAESQQ